MNNLSVSILLLMAGAANAGIPEFDLSCPKNMKVHADAGGSVFINGKKTKLTKYSETFYEAKGAGVTLSIGINTNGTPSVSYTGKQGANGVCKPAQAPQPPKEPGSSKQVAPSSSAIAPGNMPAYCRGEASSKFSVKPAYIHTGKATRVKGGGYAIKGSADLGDQVSNPFQCNFDADGNFTNLTSLVDEGDQ